MANEPNGGKRTRPSDLSIDEIMSYARSSSSSSEPVDNSVVDEILRSISDQSTTPVPNTTRRPAVDLSATQTVPTNSPTARRVPVTNSYEAAAHAHQQAGPAASPAASPAGSSTGPLPDPAYYAMRDPSQTQSFQPARPTQRNTDRLPTIVEEKTKAKTTTVGKVLTILVAILVVVALVLGVKMLYILAPSLGWNLPDPAKLPGISTLVDMVPKENIEDQIPDDVTNPTEEEGIDAPVIPDPTTITLDVEELTLEPGQTAIITATLDVPDWEGDISWGTNDKNIAMIEAIDSRSAQVTYVGEGRCWIAALVPVTPADGSSAPSASCVINCGAASVVDEPIVDVPVVEEPVVEEQPAAEHVEIKLNTYRDSGEFSLKVGAVHTLLSEANDKITFSSSNEAVATVAHDGTVTAKGAGTCTITATDPDGCKVEAICRVTR